MKRIKCIKSLEIAEYSIRTKTNAFNYMTWKTCGASKNKPRTRRILKKYI